MYYSFVFLIFAIGIGLINAYGGLTIVLFLLASLFISTVLYYGISRDIKLFKNGKYEKDVATLHLRLKNLRLINFAFFITNSFFVLFNYVFLQLYLYWDIVPVPMSFIKIMVGRIDYCNLLFAGTIMFSLLSVLCTFSWSISEQNAIKKFCKAQREEKTEEIDLQKIFGE